MFGDIARTVSAATIAQAAGFAKAILIAYYFGIGALLDGYYLAQAIPVTLAGVLTGFVQTGFIPLYAAARANGRHDEARAIAGTMLALVGTVGLSVGALLSIAAPLLVPIIAGGGPSVATAGILSMQALAFLVLLNALADSYGLLLNVHGRFVAPSLAQGANALAASALLVAAPDWGLANLIAGTLGGLLLQIGIVAWIGRRSGVRLSLQASPTLGLALRSGRAVVPALVFSNLTLLVPTTLASHIGEGAVTALSLALRLHLAATQALGIAVSAVLLPRFASAFALGRAGDVLQVLRAGFPTAAVVGLGMVIWVALAGPAFIRVVLERGAFDASATSAVSVVWLWLSVGVFPSIWGIALAKVLQALQRGAMLSIISATGFVTVVTIAGLAVGTASLKTLAASLAVAATVCTVVCAIAVRRELSVLDAAAARAPTGAAVAFGGALIATAASFIMPETNSIMDMTLLSLGCIAAAGATLFAVRRTASAQPLK